MFFLDSCQACGLPGMTVALLDEGLDNSNKS